MTPVIALLLVVDLIIIVASIWLLVVAYRVRPWWALIVLLPFGAWVFAAKHWQAARSPFLTILLCGGILGGIIATQPELLAKLKKQGGAFDRPAAAIPQGSPHEARDLAGNATPAVASVPAAVDPYAARAAYVKHHAELTALYQRLAKERGALKPGKLTADFNAKAARYQDALKTLAAEKVQLDALEHPAAVPTAKKSPVPQAGVIGGVSSRPGANGPEAEAAAALDRLRLMANAEDYPGFAEMLKKCLANYRQSALFPQMVSLGRQTLSKATPDKLSALVRRQTDAAHTEVDAVTRQIQGIVNQTPPTVPKPAPGANVHTYEYHPGATKPDFNTAEPIGTREPWQGEFVHMKTAPDIYYRSADCEFNAQTKYFYTSRNAPKKKLSDAEYREVTRLYRILGGDEKLIVANSQRLSDAGRASSALLALNAQLASLPPK